MSNSGPFTRTATPPERELWLATQLAPDLTVFTTAHAFTFAAGVDHPALARAWDYLVAAVPLLNARLSNRDGNVEVVARTESAPRLAVATVPSQEAVAARCDAARQLVFDPVSGPLSHAELIRHDGNGADTLTIAISHLAADGFAWSVLLRELQQAYAAIRAGDCLADKELPAPVPMEVSESGVSWARRNMASLPHPSRPPFPIRQARPRAALRLPSGPKLSQLPSLALAAAAVTASQHSRRSRVAVDVPFLARNGALYRVPATAMNVVPLAVDLSCRSAPELINQCEQSLSEARPHTHVRTEQTRRAHTASGAPAPVADIAMNLIPFSLELRLDGISAAAVSLSSGPGDVPAVGVRGQSHGGFQVEVDAPAGDGRDAEAASAELAERFVAAFTQLSQGHYPEETTAAPPAPPPDVLDRIGSCVNSSPDHPAFIGSGNGEVATYREIWEAAGVLAKQLADTGIDAERTVGILAPRGPQHAIAALGVLRSGGAFVPLPVESTGFAARRRIVETIRLDAVVGAGSPDELGVEPGSVPFLPIPDGSGPCLATVAVNAGQLAYVIATSGSTGVPKPVAITRGALSKWVAAILDDYLPVGPTDRIAQFAAVQFDASIEELFGALCSGATLVPRSPRALEAVGSWLGECSIHDVTVLDLPTGYWHELVRAMESGAARLPGSVHTVIIGGEAASAERLQQWHANAPQHVRLVNTYGPTESTVVATRQVLAGPRLS